MAKEPHPDTTRETEKQTEIDLLELGRTVWAQRKRIGRYTLMGAAAGLVIAFSIPRTYTTAVSLAPESKGSAISGNAGGIAAMMGINLGGGAAADGITTDLYPDIVRSTPFLLEFVDIPVTLSKQDDLQMPLLEYLTEHQKSAWWSYLFSLPGRMIGWVSSIGREKEVFDPNAKIDPFRLPPLYRSFIGQMNLCTQVKVDGKSSLILLEVTMQDPLVSAVVADSLVSKLQRYMTLYKTQKTRQSLEMSQRQYEEAKANYYAAEDLLAQASDRNRTVSTESLRVRLERLRNERNVAFNVYNQTAAQVEVNRIKLAEDMPIATVVEPAIVPDRAAAPNKKLIFVGFAFLGAAAVVGWIVVKELLKVK